MGQPTEKWEEICFLLSTSIKAGVSERDFENQVVRTIEKLDWFEYKGEIQRQPNIQLGRKNSIRPDVVLYDSKKPVIVIEVKRPAEDLTKDESSGQLISYMRQMKADFGLLIGQQIRMYYDGYRNPQQNPLLLDRITFDKKSDKGVRFVEIFSKHSFINKGFDAYLTELLDQFKAKSNLKKLKTILLNDDTKNKILDFLQHEYEDYGSEIVSLALKDLKIELIYQGEAKPENMKKKVVKKPDSATGSPKEQIFRIIDEHPNGISVVQIRDATGLPNKVVSNTIHRLKKKGRIKAILRGVYKRDIESSAHNKSIGKVIKKVPSFSTRPREQVIKIIEANPEGISPSQIREKLGLKAKTVSNCLHRLRKSGRIVAINRGVYKVV